ncbi:RNA-binding protein 43 isoform X2 [Mastacembelus armatus]|uniref:RNA-binding protein 43 isoform X2 n=1 Tax=Mastacembelus armatus TaxID=205130 RepID=UPI000E45973C|nr:RNA-binding protein 43 isoform X2 [Mastacembelus armatus]
MESGSWDESRTVVVSGVIDVLPVSRMIDKLTIHFQSPKRSRGGDVEVVTYPTNMKGVAFVTFDKAEDAKRVVGKEQQVMMDRRFPEDYRLTVFPFTRDVFLYVLSATLDLSVFGSDQVSLIQSLQSTHRSSPCPGEGKVGKDMSCARRSPTALPNCCMGIREL